MPIKKKDGVFIDAFLGGGSVSLYAKAKRKFCRPELYRGQRPENIR